MAKTTITQITDDIDGSTGAEEISFAYDGVPYTIDLGKKNRAAFEKALKPYLAVAARQSARGAVRGSRRSGSRATGTHRDLAEIRAWAKSNGMRVSDRGRVSRDVIEAFDAR